MKRFLVPLLLLSTPVMAQQPPPLQSNIDAGVAQVSRVVTGFGNEIAAQAITIDQLQRQIAAVTAERDKLKAEAAKKPEAAPAPEPPKK